MKQPEATYLQAGYAYERAKTDASTRAMAETLRAMLDAEHPHDRPEARRLIEQGRTEARQVSPM